MKFLLTVIKIRSGKISSNKDEVHPKGMKVHVKFDIYNEYKFAYFTFLELYNFL